MKIERISENKIKCTLNREDLASHNIVLTEFAYGSEKARAFFRDLMIKAEDEVGFEADNIPLMIEAIPVNQDCIVLFVTKVSDPDELDSRFSRFTDDETADEESDVSLDEDGSDISEDSIEDGQTDLFGAVKDAVKNAVEGLSGVDDSSDDFVPLTKSAAKLDANKKSANNFAKIYLFKNLDSICSIASCLKGKCHFDNTLYKDMSDGEYYLVLNANERQAESYNTICNSLSEYGKRLKQYSYAQVAYYEEHYICVIRSNAIQTLANI